MWDFTVTSASVTVAVAGDPVNDPFAAYVWTPPAMPDNVLTPAEGRALYEAGVVSGPWDMAKGTSRWIIPNYDNVPTADSSRIAAQNWFGCSSDGSTGLTFPRQSAVLDLLNVSVTTPSRVNVSYGWVIDGNPEVKWTVTNTSDYSLPGFYGQPSQQLYLVKNGRVIAQAYPVNVDPTGGVLYAMDSYKGAATDTASPDVAQYYGLLMAGTSLDADTLWRDVSGCWNGEKQAPVTAGTYTLLTMQSIYLQTTDFGPTGIMPPVPEPAVSNAEGVKVGAPSIVAPGGGDPSQTYDYVELQMWTSLGTVTITTN